MTDSDYSYLLINWFKIHQRELPWRVDIEPYKTWLSEVILQQTQVKQGLPYFNKFIRLFPSVHDLANADESVVLKAWEGLGYYSRARNLHVAAKYVSQELAGKFPNNYKGLLKLKGVGDYTASAIASIAYGEVVPAIDGNVNRVTSRLFDISKPVDSKEGKTEVRAFLMSIIDPKYPGDFNQAMMELGAMVCKPTNPNCNECPLNTKCLALKNNTIDLRPIKKSKVKVKTLYIDYLFLEYHNQFILEQRDNKGIWKSMFEFPQTTLSQKPKGLEHLETLRNKYASSSNVISFLKEVNHKLTHRNLCIRFFACKLEQKPSGNLFSFTDLERMAMPKPLVDFFKLSSV